MNVQVIRELRATKVAEARALIQKSEAENRQLTPDEVSVFEAIKKIITDLESQEGRAQFLADAARCSYGR